MRFVIMLLGLAMLALAGLWFFTSALDPVYSRHVPHLAHARAVKSTSAPASAPRSSSSAPQVTQASAAGAIGSKAVTDNVMSMINLGAGIAQAYFTYMSYRLQQRQGRRVG